MTIPHVEYWDLERALGEIEVDESSTDEQRTAFETVVNGWIENGEIDAVLLEGGSAFGINDLEAGIREKDDGELVEDPTSDVNVREWLLKQTTFDGLESCELTLNDQRVVFVGARSLWLEDMWCVVFFDADLVPVGWCAGGGVDW